MPSLVVLSVILLVLKLIRARRRRGRRFRVRPFLAALQVANSATFRLDAIRLHDEEFIKQTRFSRSQLELLLQQLAPDFVSSSRGNNLNISIRICSSLECLTSESSIASIADKWGIGRSTLRRDLVLLTESVMRHMRSYIALPSSPLDWHIISTEFYGSANYPNCIGALDGKHVRIQHLPHSGSSYYNFHRFFSVNLMAVCSSDYKIVWFDCGSPGSNNDSHIFNTSSLHRDLSNGSIPIPAPSRIPNSQRVVPYHLIGDGIFGLSHFLMKPYKGHNLTLKERIFNYRLSRARRFIENTFGILVARFRLFRKPMSFTEDFIRNCIISCVILHNFIVETRSDCDHSVDVQPLPSNISNLAVPNPPPITTPESFRSTLRDYFSGEGAVPWQPK